MTIRTNRPDPFRLDGRMALVSGASGYLGRAVALELAEAGATILLCARHAAKLEPLREDVEARGARAVPVPLNPADAPAVRGFFEGLKAAGGHLDILVNTHAPVSGENWENANAQDFMDAAASFIAAPFEITRAAVPLLERAAGARGQAAVVNVAGVFGTSLSRLHMATDPGPQTHPHAGPAQAGLLQLTRYMAARLGPKGIRVNAVVPGPVPTPAIESAFPRLAEDLKRLVPLGRLGTADDVAPVVRFLTCNAAGYMTGATLPVDGGCALR